MMLTLWESPAVVGLIVGAPMAILGFLGWWRSRGMDAEAKEEAEERYKAANVNQVIKGLESVIKALQDDNLVLRGTTQRLEERIDKLEREIRELRNGRNK